MEAITNKMITDVVFYYRTTHENGAPAVAKKFSITESRVHTILNKYYFKIKRKRKEKKQVSPSVPVKKENRYLTPNEVDYIIDLNDGTKTQSWISKHCGVSQATVSGILKRNKRKYNKKNYNK